MSTVDEISARILRECWCGRRAAGHVDDVDVDGHVVEAHDCDQCPEHCQAVVDVRRCQFALCRLEATCEVDSPDDGPSRVCDLHVVPAIRWGVAEPEACSVIRLIPRPRPAA